MSALGLDKLPEDAAGLRLCRIDSRDELFLCDTVIFTEKRRAVDTTLRRAAIAGHVEVDPAGPLPDHFADVMDEQGDMIANVALDAKSYRALKTKWMRCKVVDYRSLDAQQESPDGR